MREKILVFTGFLLFFIVVDSFGWTFIHKKGGRRNSDNTVTYDRVSVSRGLFVTSIMCVDDGNNGCPEEVRGPNRPDDAMSSAEQTAVAYMLQQISQGTLSGNRSLAVPGYGTLLRVKWSASSVYQESGDIKVWKSGEAEPSL